MKKITLYFMSLILLLQPIASFALSESDLEQIEKQFLLEINKSNQVIRDPLSVEYINQLGKKLAKQTRLKHFMFFIVKSNEINAFAGPGGYIGINSQLILVSNSEDELASVMAHELSHVALDHIQRMIAHQKQMTIPMIASTLASIALGIINPALGNGALMASLSGYAQDSINFTRANEKEADRMGINLLYKAGLNPQGMVDFFKKLQQTDRYYSSQIPAILRTHPLDEDRIAEALNRISQLPTKRTKSSQEYELFKEKIRVLSSNQPIQLLSYYKQALKTKKTSLANYYGKALTLIKLSQYLEARTLLQQLVSKDEDNLYFQLPLAEAEIGSHQPQNALARLNDMVKNYPDNYAAIMAYAKGLNETKRHREATLFLLDKRRLFPNDILLCHQLARTYSKANKTNHAYFTQAQCFLLEGDQRAAMRQLRVAQKLEAQNSRLTLQIKALQERIKSLASL